MKIESRRGTAGCGRRLDEDQQKGRRVQTIPITAPPQGMVRADMSKGETDLFRDSHAFHEHVNSKIFSYNGSLYSVS